MEKSCVNCGKVFVAKTERAKYCCKKCSNHYSRGYKRTIEEVKDDYAEFKRKALDLYRKGYRIKEIAGLLGKDYEYTQKCLYKAGVRFQKKQKIVYAEVMRFCKACNNPFLCDPRANKIYCSKICESKSCHLRHDVIRRARKKEVVIDKDISLQKVCEIDNCICYLCGLPINWNDYTITNGKRFASRMYPSIDHVVPLTEGGTHSWSNVRLAHFSCNASKGAKVMCL